MDKVRPRLRENMSIKNASLENPFLFSLMPISITQTHVCQQCATTSTTGRLDHHITNSLLTLA